VIYFIIYIILLFFSSLFFIQSKISSIVFYYYGLFIIFLISSFRWDNWTDWGPYYQFFFMNDKLSGYFEKGYEVFNIIINRTVPNYTIFMVIVNFIIIYGIHKFLSYYIERKYLVLTLVPLYLFMMYSGAVRQFLAISIVLLALIALFNERKIKYIIYTILASTFHTSAVVTLIIPLLIKWNLSKRIMWVIVFSSVIVSLFFVPELKSVIVTIGTHINIPGVKSRIEEYTSSTGIFLKGNNIYGVLSALRVIFPFILLSINIDFSRIYQSSKDRFILNFYFLGMIISILLSNVTFVSLKRFYLYFKITELMVLPLLMKYSKRRRVFIFLCLAIFYLADMIYTVFFTYKNLYLPFNFFWNQ